MTVFAFGPRWESELTKDAFWARTPTGEWCIICTDDIKDGDQGLYVAALGEPDPALFTSPVHKECYMVNAETARQEAEARLRDLPPMEVVLAAIDHALRTPKYEPDANLAFTKLCDLLGVDPGTLRYERDWAKKYYV